MASEYECPKCGIIYDKFEAKLKNSQSEPENSEQNCMFNLNICRIIISLIFVAIGLFIFYLAWSENDSSLGITGVWPMIIGFWLGGADMSLGNQSSYIGGGGDSGNGGGDGGRC